MITSSIFHYEFEFIHPFEDGNGRMGRLWQSLILSKWKPLFEQLPVENLIYQRQQQYYLALNSSNRKASATPYIEFILSALRDQLQASLQVDVIDNVIEKLASLLSVSSRTIARDLQRLVKAKKILRIGSARAGKWDVI